MAKLSGLRVLDLSQFLPGPMVTQMMADQGADVLKIEPPAGDPARGMSPFEDGMSFWFRSLNRGKRSLVLDLKSSEGKATLWSLIEGADVLLESFRPGVMARLGFDYQTVATKNPRIVYCSISAFGQTGTWADHPAHDIAAQALSGLLSVNDGPDGTPVVPGVPASDMAAALTALSAILMALVGRAQSGAGDYVDVSMLSSLLPWTTHLIGSIFTDGETPHSATQRSLGGAAFYQVYETADGKHVVLAGRELKFVRTLMTELGHPELALLGEAEPGPAQQPLKDFLAATFKTRSRDAWVTWFVHKDIAFAPVLNLAEMPAHDAVRHSGMIYADTSGHHQIRSPIRFSDTPGVEQKVAPQLGADAANWL
jgi:crotonobetainyl-CoA:carnitine CoA-transferase CaiB-like acyl-CoA transferase